MKKILLFGIYFILSLTYSSLYAQENISLSYSAYLSETSVDSVIWLEYYDSFLYIWLNTNNLHSAPMVHSSSQDGIWKIVVFDVANKNIYRQIILDWELLDFEVKNDRMYVVTNKSTQILTLNGLALISKPQAIKISVDSRGNYILLNASGDLSLYNSNNTLQFQLKISKTSPQDILIDGTSWKIFVAGYDDKIVLGKKVSVAFLHAFDYSGTLKYQLFDFEAQNLVWNEDSTQLYQLSMWADKKLYILWETTGEKNIFRYNGKNLSWGQFYTSFDAFTQLSAINNSRVIYFAKVHPEDGIIEKSWFSLSRSSLWDAASYSIQKGNIQADKNGNIIIAGENAFSFSGRENIRINGQKLDIYTTGDGTIQALDNQFLSRKFWTAFGKTWGAKTQMNDVVFLWEDQFIALGTIYQGEVFTTTHSLKKKTNDKNAFLVIFSVQKNTSSQDSLLNNNANNNSSISAQTKYDEYIKTALVNPNISAREKLEKYIHPNYYTPKNTKAAKAYILLSWKFNEKKNMLLRSKRAITQADLDIFRNYTISLYNLIYAIDSKKPTSELKKLAKYFSQDYKNVMNIK